MKLKNMEDLVKGDDVISFTYCNDQKKSILVLEKRTIHVKMSMKTYSHLESFLVSEELLVEIDNKKFPDTKQRRINWDGVEELYDSGVHMESISAIVNCSAGTLSRKINQLIAEGVIERRHQGILKNIEEKKRFEKLMQDGGEIEDITIQFNCSEYTAKRLKLNYIRRSNCGFIKK
ncbi:MAG: hypothetical protein ACRCZ0_05955 [Cetobacterium sp.]